MVFLHSASGQSIGLGGCWLTTHNAWAQRSAISTEAAVERGNNGQVSTRLSNYPIIKWAKGQQLVAKGSFRNTGKHSPKRPQKTGLELGESRVNVNEYGLGRAPLLNAQSRVRKKGS